MNIPAVNRLRLRKRLGLKDKIPIAYNNRFNSVELPDIPGTWDIVVHAGAHGSEHRVFVICKCDREIPAGRLHQHARACHALEH